MKTSRILLALAVAACASAAFAGGKPPHPINPQPDRPPVYNGGAGVGVGVGVGIAASESNAAAAAVSGGNSFQANPMLNSSLAVTNEAAEIPVSTATAPALTSSGGSAQNGTCFGSGSVGAQGPGFGVAFGSTSMDDACNRRYNAMHLKALGFDKAAVATMCLDTEVRTAMETAGTPCPATKAEKQAKAAPVQHTDPFVRRRLGLPPL